MIQEGMNLIHVGMTLTQGLDKEGMTLIQVGHDFLWYRWGMTLIQEDMTLVKWDMTLLQVDMTLVQVE